MEKKKFEVYTLDMFPDGDGGWVENEIGRAHV